MTHTRPPMRRANSRRIAAASDKLDKAIRESCAELTRFLLVVQEAEGAEARREVPHPRIADFLLVAKEFREIIQDALYPPIAEPEPAAAPEPEDDPDSPEFKGDGGGPVE